jgi:hypothetical protein
MHFRYGKTFCTLAQECEENMLVKLSSEQSRKTIDKPVRFLPPKMVPDKANMRLQHTLNKYKRSKDFKGKCDSVYQLFYFLIFTLIIFDLILQYFTFNLIIFYLICFLLSFAVL